MSKPVRVVDFNEGEDIYLAARIEKIPGTNLLKADVRHVEFSIFDPNAEQHTTPVLEVILQPTTVLSDTLQTGPYWDEDSTGYNFLHIFTPHEAVDVGALNLSGGHTYIFEYRFILGDSRWRVLSRKVRIHSMLTQYD